METHHTSKSIKLPVFRLIDKPFKTITLRNNFYNWKVSVKSLAEMDFNFVTREDVRSEPRNVLPVYCEGFKEEWVHDPYVPGCKQFTAELYDTYEVYALFSSMFPSPYQRDQ